MKGTPRRARSRFSSLCLSGPALGRLRPSPELCVAPPPAPGLARLQSGGFPSNTNTGRIPSLSMEVVRKKRPCKTLMSRPSRLTIDGLADLLRDETPGAIRAPPPDHYRGRILAVDASIFICQFRAAIPSIVNRDGRDISVLQGLFFRTTSMLRDGIRPVFVFDGKPPDCKRAKPAAGGGATQRGPSAGPERHRELKRLLALLGVPFIQAPGEAEATCAALVVSGGAWGAVTEDMDALPFGCPRLIRNLKADKNKEIEEYHLPEILETLGLTQEQFVDLCILLGCDYSPKIRTVGVRKALRMIQEFKSIERILPEITPQDRIPPDFAYREARMLFMKPAVATVDSLQLEWRDPDEDGVRQFLSNEKHMNIKKVQSGLMKLHPAEKPRKRKAGPRGGPSPEKQKKISDFFPVRKSAARMK